MIEAAVRFKINEIWAVPAAGRSNCAIPTPELNNFKANRGAVTWHMNLIVNTAKNNIAKKTANILILFSAVQKDLIEIPFF